MIWHICRDVDTGRGKKRVRGPFETILSRASASLLTALLIGLCLIIHLKLYFRYYPWKSSWNRHKIKPVMCLFWQKILLYRLTVYVHVYDLIKWLYVFLEFQIYHWTCIFTFIHGHFWPSFSPLLSNQKLTNVQSQDGRHFCMSKLRFYDRSVADPVNLVLECILKLNTKLRYWYGTRRSETENFNPRLNEDA